MWQHKSGANILIKLIRLMEVFRRHTSMNILFEKQIHCNGSFSFDLLKIWNSRKCWVWAIYDITPSVKGTDRYRGFTYVLKQAKTVIFSLYNLSGRIYHFFRKSTLHVNGFSNSDQFESICLDYAYQLVD